MAVSYGFEQSIFGEGAWGRVIEKIAARTSVSAEGGGDGAKENGVGGERIFIWVKSPGQAILVSKTDLSRMGLAKTLDDY